MIGQMRHWRQRLSGAFNAWLPARDTTVTSLRPLPGELHRDGQPTEAFWQHLVDLCAQGWLAGAGHLSALPAPPITTLVSSSGRTPLKPFGKLIVVTELARHTANGPNLLHLVCTASGVAVASATSQVTLAGQATPLVTRTLIRARNDLGSALTR